MFVALLILASFVANLLENQLNPGPLSSRAISCARGQEKGRDSDRPKGISADRAIADSREGRLLRELIRDSSFLPSPIICVVDAK